MTQTILTAHLVARQESFGDIELMVALDSGEPLDTLDAAGIHADVFINEVMSLARSKDVASGVTAADVPPPRDDRGHEHVLVVGEVAVGRDDDGTLTYDLDVYEPADRDTRFLGKDIRGVGAEKPA